MTGRDPDRVGWLRDQPPGWRVWVSQTGRCWAMREDALTAPQVAAGCLPLLWAADGDLLAVRIQEQDTLRQLHPALRLTTLVTAPISKAVKDALADRAH